MEINELVSKLEPLGYNMITHERYISLTLPLFTSINVYHDSQEIEVIPKFGKIKRTYAILTDIVCFLLLFYVFVANNNHTYILIYFVCLIFAIAWDVRRYILTDKIKMQVLNVIDTINNPINQIES